MAKRPFGRQRSSVVTIPAPYGGWNARDALTAMKPTDAITLINFVPDEIGVRSRKGYTSHSTGVGTRCDTLMEYSGPTAQKLFAASSAGTIYEIVSTSTATNGVTNGGIAFTNGKFQHTMMGTPAGAFLWICNGSDVPYKYDGTTWATASVTGCTAGSSTFVNVALHQSRLWVVQKNTLDAWYLPTASVEGVAARLQLGPFCKKGGYLQAIASWTRDGGNGMDDQLVFITSEGEAIIYSGTDPSSATTWSKVGTFEIPKPVGRRCVTQIGADLAIITELGVVPLSAVLPLSPGGDFKVAVTQKITQAFQQAYRLTPSAFGWQVIENSAEHLLIVNVPVEESVETEQFIMNTSSGSWARWTGIDAQCWINFRGTLYFGGMNGTVYRYGSGYTDNGVAIRCAGASAFTDMKKPNVKQFYGARPAVILADGAVPGVGIHLDYDTSDITTVGRTAASSGTQWDTAQWDSFQWAGFARTMTRDWQTVQGIGTSVSIEMQAEVSDEIIWNATDLMFEQGGYL